MGGEYLKRHESSKSPKYEMFQVLDFMEDKIFRLWVRDSDNNYSVAFFWKEWFETHPQNIGEALKAKQLLLTIMNDGLTHDNFAAKQHEIWERINRKISNDL